MTATSCFLHTTVVTSFENEQMMFIMLCFEGTELRLFIPERVFVSIVKNDDESVVPP
jgi:hypothetical protein